MHSEKAIGGHLISLKRKHDRIMLTSFATRQLHHDLARRFNVNLKVWICEVVEEEIRVKSS